MKEIKLIIFICVIALVSCQKDPDIPIASLTIQDKVEAEWLDATLSGIATANTKVEKLYVQLCTDESFDNIIEMNANFEEGIYKLPITKLIPQTTYYYRYRAENILSSYIDPTINSFRTKDYVAPIVTTDSITNITGKKANLFGTMAFDCGKPILEQGFEYGTDKSNFIKAISDSAGFTKQLQQLCFGTQYYYRAYATSEIGTGYGEIKTFKTCDEVKFGDVKITNITAYSANAEYSIVTNGGMPILKQGFRYWKKETNDTAQVESMKFVNFQQLAKDQTYQLCAFAETEDSCFLSALKEFTTKNGEITLKTLETTNISYTSAKLNAHIEDQGGASISQKGFVYSNTEKLPTTQDNKVVVLGEDSTYHYEIKNLEQNTCYHIRAFATNDYGTYYGNTTSFTTTYKAISFGPTKILSQSAQAITLEGNIISDGDSPIIEKGFCYSKSPNPTTKNTYTKIEDSGLGNYQIEIINLEQGTKYYIRPYAINSNDTFYGTEITISTQSGIPTFSAVTYSDVTSSSVRISGEIVSDGGSTILERGFCYSMSEEPSVQDKKVTVIGTLGNMSASINNLQNDTKYYVRAFVINEIGVFYSNIVDFSTLSGIAVLTETKFSNVLARSMTLTSTISSDGGNAISERGFCYSTTDIPTINSNKIAVLGSVGEMQTSIKDLIPSATYHFRSYAINDYGTFYGSSSQIIMPSGDPVFGNITVSNIKTTSAEIYYSVISDGGTPILTSGICYGTNSSPTIDDSCIKSTNNIGENVAYLTQLERGKKYTVRIYITSLYGTIYSEPICFDTPDSPIQFTDIQFPDICVHSIRMNCSMIYEPGSVITECGFAYTTEQYPNEDVHRLILSPKSLQLDTTAHLLHKNTTYKVYAYAIIDNIEFKSLTWTIKTLNPPEGAAPEIYTVSYSSQKVYIARGNLQYNAASSDWRFAEDQTELLGKDASPWVDRFRYGTNSEGEIKSWNDNCDWGMVNSISNGGNIKGLWHTPTGSQWVGLFNNHKRALATIAGISGLIFFPDNWVTPIDKNIKMGGVEMNMLTSQDWKILEDYGAIFLRFNEVDLRYYYKDETIYHLVQVSDVTCILEPYWTAGYIADWVEPIGKYSGYYVQGHFIEKNDTRFKSGYFSQGNYFPIRLFQDYK